MVDWRSYVDPATGVWYTDAPPGFVDPAGGTGGYNFTQTQPQAPSGPAGPSFPGGPYGAVDPYVAALQQQYLTDRLQQIEIPTLDLARSRQAFDIDLGNRQFGLQSGAFDLQRAQSDAAMTGYVPTQQMGRDAALDYLYANSPQVQNLARVQGWNSGDPAARRNSMATYLKSVGDYFRANPGQAPDAFEQSILNYGGDPVAITSAMQQSQPQQSTFTRQQWQSGQDAARRQQQMQQAELLGYMPGPTADGLGNEPTYRAAVMPDSYADPMRYDNLGASDFDRTDAFRQLKATAGATPQPSYAITTGPESLANEPTRRSLPSAGFSDGPPVTGQTFDTGGDDLSQFPGGTPTLAARQWQAANQLGIRAQNLAERRAGEDQAARIAGLTGQYNGQNTQAAQQQAFQQGIERERLGLQSREQTLAEVAQAAQSGIASRAQSLAEQRAADEQAGRLFGQGIAGRGQSLAELTAEREYGLGGRAQALAEQRAADEQAARLFGQGIQGRVQTLAESEAARRAAMERAGASGYMEGPSFDVSRIRAALSNNFTQPISQVSPEQFVARFQSATGVGGDEARRAYEAIANATFRAGRPEVGAEELGQILTGAGIGRQQTLAGQQQQFQQGMAEREYGLSSRAQTLAEQRAADEQAARLFGQGIAGRGQSLAELQAEREYGLGGRAQTLSELQAERGYGLQGRAQTLAEQEAARRGGLEAAALTGSYNGQATIAGRSLEEQVAARQAQDALRAAEMTGVYGGQQTLGARQLGQQNEQFYANLRSQMANTPRNWATYQKLQGQGAFGPMQATETYGDVGGANNANWWQQAQADGRSGAATGQQSWFSQPTSFKPQDWANMDDTSRQLEEGKWLAAGIRPEDAKQRMTNSWNTGTAARASRWAA